MGHFPIGLQFRFKGQFRLLEFQQRFLHADRREQHVMSHASPSSLPVGVEGGLVINRPGVFAASGAGRQAGDHHIRGLVEGLGSNGGGIGDVAKADLCALEIVDHLLLALAPPDATTFAGEGHHLVTPFHQLLHNKTTDVAGGSEHHHPHLFRGAAAEVVTQSHGARDWTTGRN